MHMPNDVTIDTINAPSNVNQKKDIFYETQPDIEYGGQIMSVKSVYCIV